jgi:hypothetical protein
MRERQYGSIGAARLGEYRYDGGTMSRFRISSPRLIGQYKENDSLTLNPWRSLSVGQQIALSEPLTNIEPGVFNNDDSFRLWTNRYYGNLVNGSQSVFNRKIVYPEWYFNHKLSSAKRNSLLCVQVKMTSERLWSYVKTITWIGDTGNLLFEPKVSSTEFQQTLLANSYGSWWLARRLSSKGGDWGLRSRLSGCQLHFRGNVDSQVVEGHIDINNPGDPGLNDVSGPLAELPDAIRHLIYDDCRRDTTHTPNQIREALLKQGIVVPKVR